jgi:hypothetical protein
MLAGKISRLTYFPTSFWNNATVCRSWQSLVMVTIRCSFSLICILQYVYLYNFHIFHCYGRKIHSRGHLYCPYCTVNTNCTVLYLTKNRPKSCWSIEVSRMQNISVRTTHNAHALSAKCPWLSKNGKDEAELTIVTRIFLRNYFVA